MSKLSLPMKRDIIKMHADGSSAKQIATKLKTVYDVQVSRQAINQFLL